MCQQQQNRYTTIIYEWRTTGIRCFRESGSAKRTRKCRLSPTPIEEVVADRCFLTFIFVAVERQAADSNCQSGVTPSLKLVALEHSRLEVMALEQLVKLGPVALGERRCLGDVSAGDL